MTQIIQISDFLVHKYKRLLYLKKHKSFKKVFYNFFAESSEKMFSVGRYFLAGTVV